jgi:hypothetical protein
LNPMTLATAPITDVSVGRLMIRNIGWFSGTAFVEGRGLAVTRVRKIYEMIVLSATY